MAKSLEEYTAEISRSYEGSRNALQKQLNAIEGNLANTEKQINEQYGLQQAELDRQKNVASQNASLTAAGNGGSFGGAGAIADKKYYNNTFVPAQTQLQTNQSQAIQNARTDASNRRTTLEGQLAQLQDTIAQAAQQRYYEALEADRQERLARAQLAAQNAANNWMSYLTQGGGGGATPAADGNVYENRGKGADFQFYNKNTGQQVKLGTVIGAMGGDFNANLRKQLQIMANQGDAGALKILTQGGKYAKNSGANFVSTGNGLYDRLGIKRVW
jgi:hypothetical protein